MKRAVILVNLGSPVAPEPAAIRSFLGQFLSDSRVVEIPRCLWLPLLHGIILPLRAPRVAGLYREIWTAEGSPLTAMTFRQAALLQSAVDVRGGDIVVRVAMTYGQPSLAAVIDELRGTGIEKFLVLPLYPQYSGTTTGAVYDQLATLSRQSRYVPDIQVIREYWHRQDFIAALAASVRQYRERAGDAGFLLFSFHGIPKACVDKGDPYDRHCRGTAQAVASMLGLRDEQWAISFQSRFGKAEWLQPYTDELLAGLPQRGIRKLDIICPAFAADCLETLEEIEVGSRSVFLESGGEYFGRIPCLNDMPEHIEMMASIVSDAGF